MWGGVVSVDPDEVRRIAGLARLRLADEEVVRLTHELNGILLHVRGLGTVAEGGAEPADEGYATGARAATRPDERGEPDALGAGPAALAPRWADGFFLVPPPPGVHGEGEG